MATTPETLVKKHLKKWLAESASWWTAISDRYHVGLPDFMCILKIHQDHGRLTAIECKSATGRPSPRQIHEAMRIERAGGNYLFAVPSEEPSKFELIPFTS